MTDYLPITLKAVRGNWLLYSQRKRNPNFIKLSNEILTRDDYTCRYCGFKCDKFQEVINADYNFNNNTPKNLMTACSFCAQCILLDGIGQDEHLGGLVIYLPEISQSELNHFCRVLFCSMLKYAPYRGKLQATYLSLQDRGLEVTNLFGPNTSDAAVFGQSLIDSQLSLEQQNHPIMQHLRILPAKKYFKEQIEYWRNTVFAKIPL